MLENPKVKAVKNYIWTLMTMGKKMVDVNLGS